jgi:hypothetical protein
MYPLINFKGDIAANRVIEYGDDTLAGQNLMFFSGGVDSFDTLISQREGKPILMTLWGSDILFNEVKAWDNVKEHVSKTAKQFGCRNIFIKSNFRKFLCEFPLTKIVEEKAKDGWWHGFQYGIGIIGHAAPIAYLYNTAIIYIASSFSAKHAGQYCCASDPTIDGRVKMARAKVIHDGYQFTRQNKVKNICEFTHKRNITLRVCCSIFGMLNGKNCNSCEKCYRTTMGILAEGYNPNDFGLFYDKKQAWKIKNDIKYKIQIGHNNIRLWRDIQERCNQSADFFKVKSELRWIQDYDFDKYDQNPIKFIYNLPFKIYSGLLKLIPHKVKKIIKRILLKNL